MSIESVHLTFRKLATCVLVAATCALSLPSSAGRMAWPVAPSAPALTVKAAGGLVEVVEFYNAGLEHYFISANPAEIAVLDGGAFGGAWKRTGGTFPAWDVVGAPADTVPVCRFFGTDRYRADGSRIGPNSHFYTADPIECAFVRTAWQSIAIDGLSYPAWTFENYAFAVKLPVGGACPSGTQALYRSYNNGAHGDPGHRYSTRADLLQGMAGWAFEGLVMCLPQGQNVTLSSPLVACSSPTCAAGTTPVGNGIGLVNLIATIANTTAAPLDLNVTAGQIFIATNNVYQDGLLLERVQATIAPGTSRQFLLRLFCMQLTREAPMTGAVYTQGVITGNAQLLDIAALADGKLGSANDPAGVKATAVQNALWEVTNGRGALTATQRSLLVSLLATLADDVATQTDIYLEFLSTLSITPRP